MQTQQKMKITPANGTLLIIGGVIYLGLIILFAFQTWGFVDWLFPQDQLLMKLLTLLAFDILALFWACVDLFYRFASRGAKWWVRIAWVLTFALSSLASVLYLVVESMFRFNIPINQDTVNIGYGVSIFAVVFNVLTLMMWLYLEWNARNPRHDDFEIMEAQQKATAQPQSIDTSPQTGQMAAIPMTPQTTAMPVGKAAKNGHAASRNGA